MVFIRILEAASSTRSMALSGEEAVRDVAVAELEAAFRASSVISILWCSSYVPEALEDQLRLLDGGLADLDGLEPALERLVLLDVLAVLVDGGRADDLDLTAARPASV